MTGDLMIDMLGLRMEDPEEASFTSDAKLKAINLAQKTVCNLIHNAYLTELQLIDSGLVPGTDGVVDLDGGFVTTTNEDSTTKKPLRGSVSRVYIDTGNVNSTAATSIAKYAIMVEPSAVKRLENSYLSSSTSNPVAYIFANKLYMLIGSGNYPDDVDIWYLKEPADVTDSSGSESELNEALHEVVLDFAESQLWKMDGNLERGSAAYQNATAIVAALNARYETERPEGIGTRGRR